MKTTRLLLPVTLLVTAGLLAPGCMFFTTKRDGEKLQKEVKALRDRIDLMKKREQATLDALKKAKGELVELKGLLPKARAILLRSSARFGVKLEQLISTVSKLQGRMENVETDLRSTGGSSKQVATRLAKVSETLARVKTEVTKLMAQVRKPRPRPGPKTASEHYAQATIARLTGRLPLARKLYGALISQWPKDPMAEPAYYWTARTFFDRYDYRGAVVAVSKQLKAHSKGKFAARGRMLSARSYFELKRCKTAIRIVSRLVRLYPHDEVTPEGRKLLLRLRKLRNVSRYCRR